MIRKAVTACVLILIAWVSAAGIGLHGSSSIIAPPETPYAAPTGTFTPVNFKGVNISGGELSYPSPDQFSYIYPQTEELDYFNGKGMGLIRVPLHARRLQPASYGPLDPISIFRTQANCPALGAGADGLIGRCDEPAISGSSIGVQTNLVQVKFIADTAFALNMYVVIDMHNFGGLQDTLTNTLRYPGADAEGTNQLVDLWTRIATKFKNYPNVIFDVMNEPNVQTAAQWKVAQVAVNNAIANITTLQYVFIEGTCFSGGHSWVSCGNDVAWAGYVPPTNLNVVYEMHEYLDSDFSGSHTTCAGNGSSPMTGATSWATTNGVKIWIGESGWSQDSSCPPDATNLFNYFSANEVSASGPYLGWAYWLGGNQAFYGSYMYTVQPSGYPSGPFTDKPQMSILVSNLP